MATAAKEPRSQVNWYLVAFFAVLPFLGFWLYGLTDVDEGFYGAATAEMNRRGEWVIPFYNGQPWFEKPILMYWFAKPSLMLFGDMVGPRLPSVLASLATLALVAWFCRRRFSSQVAAFAVLVLSGSLLFVAAGRMMLTDPILVFFLTAAFLTFWESLVDNPRWRLLTAAALGFAVLAKGPVALALFVVLAAITYWKQPDLRSKFRGYWPSGTLILFAVMALWYVPVYLARPDGFVQEFIVRQNIGRFLGGDEAHKVGLPAGLVYYIPILLLGMLPWSMWLFKSWQDRDAGDPNRPLTRYLGTWALLILGFFTISSTKLPHYILPAFTPLAMLSGYWWVDRRGKRAPWALTYAWIGVMFLIANLGFWGWYHGWFKGSPDQSEVHEMARFVRRKGGPVALYQMSRRNKALGTGELKVQETSLPSLLLYLDQTVIDTDDSAVLAKAPKPLWVITRANRFDRQKSFDLEGQHFEAVREGKNYYLYRVISTPRPASN